MIDSSSSMKGNLVDSKEISTRLQSDVGKWRKVIEQAGIHH
jgi:hypothetical protein